ncbi:MAG: class I SAM-dependent methyltransferase [Candidatus Shapirobacteria bacterium]
MKTKNTRFQECVKLLQPNLRYKVQDNIIVFTPNSNLEGDNKKYTRFYNLIAKLYDFGSWVFFRFYGGEKRAREEFLEKVKVKSKDKVLEVSIGTGINIQILPSGASYFGVDISHGMLSKCLKNFRHSKKQLYLLQTEAENLPFKDNTFDIVFHVGGVNFFNNKKKAIEEMVRVAKPGVYITIVDETDNFFDTFKWIPFVKKFFKTGQATKPPIKLLPSNTKNIEVKELIKGNYWRLSFQKS